MAILKILELKLLNFATFEDQTIPFSEKFNAIVGETGSGKSLILEALQLILGARSDKSFIRKGAEFACVESTFSAGKEVFSFFDGLGHPYQDEVHIKRIIYRNGKSKSFLNHQACSSTTLSKVAKRFIDLVGQFENQKLLSSDYQLVLLDSFASSKELLVKYQIEFSKYLGLKEEREQLLNKKNESEKRRDYLEFQIKEIEQLSPSIERENELLDKKKALIERQSSRHSFEALSQILTEGDTTLSSLLSNGKRLLNGHPALLQHIQKAQEEIDELSYKMGKLLNEDDCTEDLESLIEELDLYSKLKRKFGPSTQQILEAYENFKNELSDVVDLNHRIKTNAQELEKFYNLAVNLSLELDSLRVIHAQELSKQITKIVRELKMKGATVKFEISKIDTLNEKGINRIDILAETNPGEGFHSIKKIASGGELSRILLALRNVVASNDSVSIFLFDEIDTGVGGETALSVGQILQRVSLSGQVIAITHLPQIAQFAHQMISVDKKVFKQRTTSFAKSIEAKERNHFLKKMTPLEINQQVSTEHPTHR